MSFFKPDSKCGLFRYDTLSWSLDFLLLYTKKITPRKQNFSAAKAIKAKVNDQETIFCGFDGFRRISSSSLFAICIISKKKY